MADEVARLREFIEDIACCQDETGKLASRVLIGMTLKEAHEDLGNFYVARDAVELIHNDDRTEFHREWMDRLMALRMEGRGADILLTESSAAQWDHIAKEAATEVGNRIGREVNGCWDLMDCNRDLRLSFGLYRDSEQIGRHSLRLHVKPPDDVAALVAEIAPHVGAALLYLETRAAK